MLNRIALEGEVRAALARSPAVALIGPRQVGKKTLARTLLAADSANHFDLEDPQVEAQLAEPMTALKDLRGLVVIDDVQHAPELSKPLRVLIDRPGAPAKFLLLGSALPALLRQSSESPISAPAPAMHRLWSMLAHFHGQVWNAADPARSRPAAAYFWAIHGGAELDLLMFKVAPLPGRRACRSRSSRVAARALVQRWRLRSRPPE